MRNSGLVLLSAICLCAGMSALAASPESNCVATVLNRDMFQPGENIVVRILPLACSPAAIDLQLSVQKYTDTWTEVVRRTVHLRGLTEGTPVVATSIAIPDGESEFGFGLYRIVTVTRPADPAYIAAMFNYRETPAFYVGGNGVNPSIGATMPPERMAMSYISMGDPVIYKDNRFRFSGRLGAGGRALALFYQFREDGTIAMYRTLLEQEDGGTALRAPTASVALPNTFRDDLPVWVHLVDPGSGVSTDQLLYSPANPMRTMPWGFAGPPPSR